MRRSVLDQTWAGYVVAALSVGALTLLLKTIGAHVNAATVSLALLLNVLFIATRWGSLPALAASIFALLCFNFFFLPPLGRFTIGTTRIISNISRKKGHKKAQKDKEHKRTEQV